MGKGDKRTRRGKINNGSHGKTRAHHARTTVADKSVSKRATRRAAPRKRS